MIKRNFIIIILLITALYITSFSAFNFVYQNESSSRIGEDKDTTNADELQIRIDEYCVARAAKITKERESNNLKHQIEQDSTNISKIKLLQQTYRKKIEDIRDKPKIDSTLITSDSLKGEFIYLEKTEIAKYDSLIKISEGNISEKIKVMDSLRNILDHLPNEISKKNTKLESTIKNLKKFVVGRHGSFSFNFCGVKYNVFVLNLDSVEINIHLFNKDKRNFYSLGAVKEYLEKKQLEPLMITNAGMFTPSNEPVGLYIENESKVNYKLDTTKRKTDENFYLSPNGVFFVDSFNIARVETTDDFVRIQSEGKIKIQLATQSGPMLLINGKLHDKFVQGSRNEKIRSGVGIINDKKVIFAITLNESNFFEFATFFRDVFNCKDALFLDGAISQMYIQNTNPITGGHFGPMISVSKKK